MKTLGKLILLLVLLLLLVPGGFLTYISTVTLYEELALWNDLRPARKWPTVPVNVLEAKLVPIPEKFLPVIPEFHAIFSYSVDGRPFTVDYSKFSGHYSIMAMNRGGLERALKPWDPMSRVKVYAHLDPANPKNAVPVVAINDAALGVQLAGACFALVMGTVMLALWFIPSFALVRTLLGKDPVEDPVKKQEEARFLKPHSDLKWLWFGLLLLVGPGFILMAVFTVPALISGGAERSYWVPVGLGFFFASLFWWRWRRNVKWWRLAGESRIELLPPAATILTPPKGRLMLAPMRDLPDTLELRYKLERRISSKNIHTAFKADAITNRNGFSGDPAQNWYAIDHVLQGVPVLQGLTNHQSVWWSIQVKGRTNGRKFVLSFMHIVQ